MSGAVIAKDRKDNVVPLRPHQASLFGDVSNDNAQPRFDPRRTLIKARVRRDFVPDDDLPLEAPVQHGLFEADEREENANLVIVDGQAISDREFLRRDVGTSESGHRRAQFRDERNRALFALFTAMRKDSGYEEAVCALFSLLSRDPAYWRDQPEQWVLQLFCDEKQMLIERFCSNASSGFLLPASPDDDDEEDGT